MKNFVRKIFVWAGIWLACGVAPGGYVFPAEEKSMERFGYIDVQYHLLGTRAHGIVPSKIGRENRDFASWRVNYWKSRRGKNYSGKAWHYNAISGLDDKICNWQSCETY